MLRALYWLLMLLLLPGMLLRVNLGGSGLLPADLLLPLYGVLWLGYRALFLRSVPRARFVLPGLVWLLIGLIGLLLTLWEMPLTEGIMSLAHWWRFLGLLCVGWSVPDLLTGLPEGRLLRRILLIVLGVIILGIVQYFLVPDISHWSTVGGWDPHMGRLLSTWMDPNYIAGMLAFCLPVVCGVLYQARPALPQWALLGLLGLGLLALYLTYSRSGYTAAVAGLLLFFVVHDRKWIALTLLAAGLTIVLTPNLEYSRMYQRVTQLAESVQSLVFQTDDSLDATASLRVQSWQESLQLAEQSPVVGIGFNTYRYYAVQAGIADETNFSAGGSDSSLLNVLITTGVLGLLVYLWFLATLVLPRLREYFTGRDTLSLGIASGVLALTLHSFFVNSLFYVFIMLLVLSLSGYQEALASQPRSGVE
ncbi:O-antigen ligase family protein [Candidatus Peribacteria bacterium]|nr:O-antigen ligase family protein [Candidatus Peribacteria bacterium]